MSYNEPKRPKTTQKETQSDPKTRQSDIKQAKKFINESQNDPKQPKTT